MKTGALNTLMIQLSKFAASTTSIIFSTVLIVGIFFAVQEKHPLELRNFQGAKFTGGSGDCSYEFSYDLPITAYGGPTIIEIHHPEINKGGFVRVQIAGKDVSRGVIPADSIGAKKFLLYPGALAANNRLDFKIESEEDLEPTGKDILCKVVFLKAGYWLVPGLFIWISIFLLAFALGATAALLWSNPAVGKACYGTISAIIILAVYIWGLEFAARLAGLLPAAGFLLLLTFIFRLVDMKRDRAENNDP